MTLNKLMMWLQLKTLQDTTVEGLQVDASILLVDNNVDEDNDEEFESEDNITSDDEHDMDNEHEDLD